MGNGPPPDSVSLPSPCWRFKWAGLPWNKSRNLIECKSWPCKSERERERRCGKTKWKLNFIIMWSIPQYKSLENKLSATPLLTEVKCDEDSKRSHLYIWNHSLNSIAPAKLCSLPQDKWESNPEIMWHNWDSGRFFFPGQVTSWWRWKCTVFRMGRNLCSWWWWWSSITGRLTIKIHQCKDVLRSCRPKAIQDVFF